MKIIYSALLIGILCISCKPTGQIEDFKIGTFKTYTNLKDSDLTSIVKRTENVQMETIDGIEYTYDIEWKSNFEYTLLNKYPKSTLDSTLFIVKITGLKKDSYTFEAHFKGSKFIQKGWVEKLE